MLKARVTIRRMKRLEPRMSRLVDAQMEEMESTGNAFTSRKFLKSPYISTPNLSPPLLYSTPSPLLFLPFHSGFPLPLPSSFPPPSPPSPPLRRNFISTPSLLIFPPTCPHSLLSFILTYLSSPRPLSQLFHHIYSSTSSPLPLYPINPRSTRLHLTLAPRPLLFSPSPLQPPFPPFPSISFYFSRQRMWCPDWHAIHVAGICEDARRSIRGSRRIQHAHRQWISLPISSASRWSGRGRAGHGSLVERSRGTRRGHPRMMVRDPRLTSSRRTNSSASQAVAALPGPRPRRTCSSRHTGGWRIRSWPRSATTPDAIGPAVEELMRWRSSCQSAMPRIKTTGRRDRRGRNSGRARLRSRSRQPRHRFTDSPEVLDIRAVSLGIWHSATVYTMPWAPVAHGDARRVSALLQRFPNWRSAEDFRASAVPVFPLHIRYEVFGGER